MRQIESITLLWPIYTIHIPTRIYIRIRDSRLLRQRKSCSLPFGTSVCRGLSQIPMSREFPIRRSIERTRQVRRFFFRLMASDLIRISNTSYVRRVKRFYA